jgi:hypothetical protein
MFISNRRSWCKQNPLNSTRINSSPTYPLDPSANSSPQSDQSADMSLEIERAHFRTLMLGIALKQAANDYFYAAKPRDIASINFAKAWEASRQHLKQWIDKPAIIRLLRAEMTIINREFGGILDDGAALH